jgi:hypothetical protein
MSFLFLLLGLKKHRENHLLDSRLTPEDVFLIKKILDAEDISLVQNEIMSLSQHAQNILLYLARCEYREEIYHILRPYTLRVESLMILSYLLDVAFGPRINNEDGIRILLDNDVVKKFYDIVFLLSIESKKKIVIQILLELMEKSLIQSTIQSMSNNQKVDLLELTRNSDILRFQEIHQILSQQKIGE